MKELIPSFERASSDKVIADFDGAIGAMAERVEAGEAADVVVVSRSQIESLEKTNKVVRGTAVNIGKVGIGVFVRKGANKPDIKSVEEFRRAMLQTKSIGFNDPAAGAPVSLYLLGLFERLGIAKEMAQKTVVFKRRSDRFEPVARGDVDLGFNQVSEILAVPNVDLVGPLPANIQNYTLFAAAVVSSTRSVEAAKRFLAFISSPQAFQAMKANGFE